MIDLKEGLEKTLGSSFSVERELSGGGMSRVFVAFDGALGRRVVVKVLPPELAASVSLERFKREILLAATLQHPHIVGVLNAGEIDGMPFFTMPWVEGESLRMRIQREGQLTVGRTVSILKDVARALAYAHERGVVHRDIKPDNVLLAGTSATVTDFGIAKALLGSVSAAKPARHADGTVSHSSLTQLGTTLGTPAYMAPEQAAADESTDHRADIYSFGIMAYEMITGQVPFKSKTPQALLAAQLTATPSPIAMKRADVPVALAGLVMQCLEKEREKRPQSAREIAELLEHPDMVSGAFASTPLRGVRSRPWRLIVAVALAIMMAGAWLLARDRDGSDVPETPASATIDRARSVVVLPFVNISPDSTDAYLADGITNGLINALARVPGIRVTSRSVASSAREKFASATEIGSALNVGRILEGTIQRDGNRLRVTARMTNADDGFMLWSDMFERELKDVFAVQDEISTAIAEALGAQMAPAAIAANGRGTTDDVAFDMYLRGRHFFEQRGEASLRRALDLFRDAARRDASFARAHAGIAAVHSVLPMYAHLSRDSLFEPGIVAATRAIELDSTLADAYASRAVLLSGAWRWAEAEADHRRAVALDPNNAAAHQWYGEMLLILGRSNEALQQLKRAAELDPVSPIIASSYSMALTAARRDAEAVSQARRAIELDSALFLPRMMLGVAHLGASRLTDAVRELETALALNPGARFVRGMLGFTYGKLGQRANAERIAAELSKDPDADALAELSMVQAGLGDANGALTSLEGAVRRRAAFFSAAPLALSPFDDIRSSPRFRAVLRSLGLDGSAQLLSRGS
jgi:serine/threonine-protein kinase